MTRVVFLVLVAAGLAGCAHMPTRLLWWIEDHRGPRGTWVDASIYGGLRTQTLVCAAQTLNDPVITAAALRDAQTMIRSYGSHREVDIGTNNTELIRQLGALAAYCWVADTPGRDRAWSTGSDVAGSKTAHSWDAVGGAGGIAECACLGNARRC